MTTTTHSLLSKKRKREDQEGDSREDQEEPFVLILRRLLSNQYRPWLEEGVLSCCIESAKSPAMLRLRQLQALSDATVYQNLDSLRMDPALITAVDFKKVSVEDTMLLLKHQRFLLPNLHTLLSCAVAPASLKKLDTLCQITFCNTDVVLKQAYFKHTCSLSLEDRSIRCLSKNIVPMYNLVTLKLCLNASRYWSVSYNVFIDALNKIIDFAPQLENLAISILNRSAPLIVGNTMGSIFSSLTPNPKWKQIKRLRLEEQKGDRDHLSTMFPVTVKVISEYCPDLDSLSILCPQLRVNDTVVNHMGALVSLPNLRFFSGYYEAGLAEILNLNHPETMIELYALNDGEFGRVAVNEKQLERILQWTRVSLFLAFCRANHDSAFMTSIISIMANSMKDVIGHPKMTDFGV